MLILASGSASRQAMLRAAGVDFAVQPAEVDEDRLMAEWQGEAGATVAANLAAEKALAISRQQPDAIVLGADSVVETASGALLQKAGSIVALRDQLWQLRGTAHFLHSAVAGAGHGRILWQMGRTATLHMRNFTQNWLDDYIARCGHDVQHSVGGYHLEALGVQLFDKVEGDHFVIRGLPLIDVLGWLREIGEIPA